MDRVLTACLGWIDNPLMRSFRQPFSEAQLSDIRAEFRKGLQSLSLGDAGRDEYGRARDRFELFRLATHALSLPARAAPPPSLPPTQALLDAQREFMQNYSTVSEYEWKRRQEYRFKERQALRTQRLLEDYVGADEQFFLEQVNTIEDTTAIQPRDDMDEDHPAVPANGQEVPARTTPDRPALALHRAIRSARPLMVVALVLLGAAAVLARSRRPRAQDGGRR